MLHKVTNIVFNGSVLWYDTAKNEYRDISQLDYNTIGKVHYDVVENHTYTNVLTGEEMRGITGVLNEYLFCHKYNGIDEEVLRNAALRGTLVHNQCERYDEGKLVRNQTPQLKAYKELRKRWQGECVSEYLVTDSITFASCIDKVYEVAPNLYDLADIKTTYNLDKEYVQWQLSVYAYLFEMQNPDCNVNKLYAIWLQKDGTGEVVEVERIPNNVIKELLYCADMHLPFVNPMQMPAEIADIKAQIKEWMDKAQEYKNKVEELKKGLLQKMDEYGVTKWQCEGMSITRKADSVRTSFDSKAFSADHPRLAKKYEKESIVKGSVIITIK